MQLFINGKQICETIPEYVKMDNGNGSAIYGIKEMSLCDIHAQLKKGDKLVIKSDYDVEKHPQSVSPQFLLKEYLLNSIIGALVVKEVNRQ
jgi:hypothetical protein